MSEPTAALGTLAIVTGLLFGFAGGAGIGWLFLTGLRLTVERLPGARRPGLVLIASVLVRMAIAVVGFLMLAQLLGWPGLAGAVAGFIVVRTLLVRRARRGWPS